MKKIIGSWLVLSVVLSLGSVSFAEGMKSMDDKEAKTGIEKGMMTGKGMMGDKKMGMMGMMGPMMMKMMMDKSVVATSDGGVVVLAGDKITKYDKDLNVVKEADVKMDMGAMKKDMMDMMKMCPMMKGDMKDMDDKAAGSESAAAGSEPVDHAAHH